MKEIKNKYKKHYKNLLVTVLNDIHVTVKEKINFHRKYTWYTVYDISIIIINIDC